MIAADGLALLSESWQDQITIVASDQTHENPARPAGAIFSEPGPPFGSAPETPSLLSIPASSPVLKYLWQ
jgi:hypothetical protein